MLRHVVTLALAAATLCGAAEASAQAPRPTLAQPDSVWDGVLIGGAAGAVTLVVSPYFFCGGFDDSECTVIVRVAIGLPALAGGLVLGGVIDKLRDRRPLAWRNQRGTRELLVRPALHRRARGVAVVWGFR